MKYLSTKEASELWNISTRRVAKLASEGRINGAKLVGHSWLIPEQTEKPLDARKNSDSIDSNRFIYPCILATISTGFNVDKLNKEEKDLYDIFMMYEQGEFESGLKKANKLLSKTDNKYIKIGCLYTCIFFKVILHKFADAKRTILQFCLLCQTEQTHRNEVMMVLNEVLFYFEKSNNYVDGITFDHSRKYSDFLYSFLSCLAIIQEIFRWKEGSTVNFITHEINLSRIKNEGFDYITMFYSFYLSILYSLNKKPKEEIYHIKQAIDIAVNKNMYTSLAGVICYTPNTTMKILKDYPKEIQDKFTSLIKLTITAFREYGSYAGNNTQLSKLTIEDCKLITYCMKGSTIEDISKEVGFSTSKTKHLLVELYQKLGIEKKNEIFEKLSPL